jgi:hypothetical protein
MRVEHPDGIAILCIDGLYLDLRPTGARLIGVQNGTDPIRLIACRSIPP